MSSLSFDEWSVLLDKVELIFCGEENDHLIITDDEEIIFSDVAKAIIHEFALDCRKSDWYEETKSDLDVFWNGENEYYTKTVENVCRVIFEKLSEAPNQICWYMSLITHIPVLDECLNGGAECQ